MKMFKTPILIVLFGLIGVCLQSCIDPDGDDPLRKEVTEKILRSKSWTASTVVVPDNTATSNDDWMNFAVSFGELAMNASGHPAGSEPVWPNGIWIVSEDGKSVARCDGVVMQLTNISESNFTATFAVPEGTEINGRIAALEGEYIFNLK